MERIAEWRHADAAVFRGQILPRGKPAVLKGVVAHWPAVREAAKSPEAFCDYARRFDRGGFVLAFLGQPDINGRFWYRPDMRGFNFDRRHEPLDVFLDRALSLLGEPNPPALYAGAVPIPDCMPGFVRDNCFDLVPAGVVPRIWIGNRIVVATHQDSSENIACVVAGHRRFTLFPPEQLPNLYVGPLDSTPAGQPVSMVTLNDPDFARYPRFREALAAAQTAELEPGDAVFIPYLWWHHVESLGPLNVLVNYWWDDGRGWLGSPFEAMVHGILAIGDLPPERRDIWRQYFDHYVFRTGGNPAEHLAADQRGILSKPTPQLAQYIRNWLLQALTRYGA